MQRLSAEPRPIQSMLDLLTTARSMEQEAVAGYQALSERMLKDGKAELASVFDRLAAEEQGHLGMIEQWSAQTGIPFETAPLPDQHGLFDDEGAGIVAPQMLSAYRAFSIAVRNEERAFVFWTYVAAHAPTPEMRSAAERMAREELGHVATLRQERRRAFHALRRSEATVVKSIAFLEERLTGALDGQFSTVEAADIAEVIVLARQARARAGAVRFWPFAGPMTVAMPRNGEAPNLPGLSELLLDCYLDIAESCKDQAGRDLAQKFAGELIHCLSVVRRLEMLS
ncbi:MULTISPECIES: ferritin family protein [Rhizobium]|uniref:Ferritin-like protein n=1 Tax=Rhizobium gallicum bv. gallicum R602sp TaxID=1041138 RepID=A0A0B4XHB2_9HYPH|nr:MULTISPECIES: ferritin family protein [Rhizobium]AJD46150.1 ferritin-like protein [Rhizobium gallicum bv. gallicum R602sp]